MAKETSEAKYQNFSDSGMRDRVAAVHAHEYSLVETGDEDPTNHKSGFSSSGWDKYYFFSNPASCAGPGKGGLHPTARQGRNRPAMSGPQTFSIQSFTPEELALARQRIEKKGARTIYSESYSQIPRSSTCTMGPIERPSGHHIMKHAAATGQSISDTLTQAGMGSLTKAASASELIAGPFVAHRAGPHWPPPGPQRPDPLRTRQELMAWGEHRTFVDLHAKDRKAPGEIFYTMTSIP
ncbi:unnamed protein product [Effrenium voratum]|uniref:Uncharacterized protein n=1 Tax=Effrenium voratum TaxID=2562239 RepID=A0AA36J0W7_9DINO|nr:unnamed protein product [Effrenium voratum]CAJ1418082.1 unnamed protein product [Effrenium voratum]